MSEEQQRERLAVELRTLRSDARRLWCEPDERARALEGIVTAWEHGDTAGLNAAVKRWDDAIVAGLEALGLPRGPIAGIVIDVFGRNWLGRKEPSCHLLIDGDVLRNALRIQQAPEQLLRMWVHESLHGRQPFVISDAGQHHRAKGFEEGMVEGLARLIAREKAGVDLVEGSYTYYVTAYQALAAVVGGDVENLLAATLALPDGHGPRCLRWRGR